MATNDELIMGLEVLIRETRRIAADLSEEQWEQAIDLDGWCNKQVLAHVAGIGAIVVPLVAAMATAPEGRDITTGNDINAMNAGIVDARAGKSAADLADEVARNYGAVIDYVRTAPEATLQKRATMGGHKDLPISDLLMRAIVLHGIGHIYSVYSGIFFARP